MVYGKSTPSILIRGLSFYIVCLCVSHVVSVDIKKNFDQRYGGRSPRGPDSTLRPLKVAERIINFGAGGAEIWKNRGFDPKNCLFGPNMCFWTNS